jgi:hypothetical protein
MQPSIVTGYLVILAQAGLVQITPVEFIEKFLCPRSKAKSGSRNSRQKPERFGL